MDIKNKKEFIIHMAHNLIIHYLTSVQLPEEEIKRVKQILDTTEVRFEKIIPKRLVSGENFGDKITIYVNDVDNITDKELYQAIMSIVHEYYHSISKERQKMRALHKKDYIFLEEGYVTLMTAKTIRHAISNPFEFEDASKEDVAKILEKVDLENGYNSQSEFVRSVQLIMSQYGYDSALIYMFSEDGREKLSEIAKTISPEFGEIMRRQPLKSLKSKNYEYEKKYFISQLKQINPDSLSETDIEMNALLAQHLTKSGIASQNQRLGRIVNKHFAGLEIGASFIKHLLELPPEEMRKLVKIELEKISFDYEPQDIRCNDASRMIEIVLDEYNDTKARPAFVDIGIPFGALIAYDLCRRGILEPEDKEIKDYLKYFCSNREIEKYFLRAVKMSMRSVKTEIDNGKSPCKILNEKLLQEYSNLIPMLKIVNDTNQDNFWENAEKVGMLVSKQNDEKGEMLYYTFYQKLQGMMERAIVPDKIYKKSDYEEFMRKMTKVFEEANVPSEFMKEIGLTPARLFFEGVSEKVNHQKRTEQMMELLDIAHSRIEFGGGHNMLQDFVFNMYAVYEDIKASGNKESLYHFRYMILKAFNSSLDFPTHYETRQRDGSSFYNRNIYYEKILDDVILDEDIYKNPQMARTLFDSGKIYFDAFINCKLGAMILKQFPNEIRERFAGEVNFKYIFKKLFGDSDIKLDEIPRDKLDSLGDIAKFLIAYEKSSQIFDEKQKNDFWSSIYPEKETVKEEDTGVAASLRKAINIDEKEKDNHLLDGPDR